MAETNNQQQDAGLSGKTERLLRSYFGAFANLYGIVPLYRALRIVQKQNPELALTEEAFLAFVCQIGQEEHHYIIAGAEDIYSGIEESTPSLKREVIAEHLYAVERLAGRGCLGSTEQINEFFRYYYDMSNHTRMAANRGVTPDEIQKRMGARSSEFGMNISRALQPGDVDMGALRQNAFGLGIPSPRRLNSLERAEQQKPPVRAEAEKSISGAAADSSLPSVRILVHRQPPTGNHSWLGAIFSVCGQICGQR